jgi:hypothetical protein
MKKQLLAVVIFFTILSNSLSAQQTWAWAHSAGGIQQTMSYGIAIDSIGNSYITGWFEDTIHFENNTFLVTTINTNQFASDMFLAKYDKDGNFIWARKVGSTGYDFGSGVAVDKFGYVYVSGQFSGSVSFGSSTLTSAGDYDIFVAKFDSNGTLLWANRGGGSGWDVCNGIAVDNNCNCYITGGIQGGPTTFGSTTLTSAGNYDVFVAKYDTNGNFGWASASGGTSDDRATGISVDVLGNTYVTGFFKNTATFGTTTLNSFGGYDAFLAKYDAAGNPVWAKKRGGADDDQGNAVKVMTSGDIYITGFYHSTAHFDTTTLISAGDQDIFVAKHDYKGDVVWAKSWGGTYIDNGCAISADTFNNVYVAGSFWGTGQFDTLSVASYNQDDAFIAGINTEEKTKWVQHGGGLNADYSTGLASAPYGRCYTTGYFNGNNAVHFGEHDIDGNSMINNNAFIAKLDSTFLYPGVPYEHVTGIGTIDVGNKIVAYPNPFRTSIKIDIETTDEIKQVELYDVLGKPVSSLAVINEIRNSVSQKQLLVNGESLPNGIYFVKVFTEKEKFTKRLVLAK